MRRAFAILLGLTLASAAYGFALGSAHSWLYAQRNLIKFPLLIVGTGSVCSLAYFVVARFLGVPVAFAHVQGLAFRLFHGASILLASLAPATFFIGRVLANTDDAQLGEYGLFLGWNVALVAIAGSLALAHQSRALLQSSIASITKLQRRAVVTAWLGLSLAVGGQGAFWLRPFFGLPASRGNVPPFALGAEPDVRGATNFYEAMWQILTSPPLPDSWR